VLRKLQIVFQNVAILEKKKWEYCNRIIPLNFLLFAFWRNFATKRRKKRKETLSEGTTVQGGLQIH
jgi:hypothetical protein